MSLIRTDPGTGHTGTKPLARGRCGEPISGAQRESGTGGFRVDGRRPNEMRQLAQRRGRRAKGSSCRFGRLRWWYFACEGAGPFCSRWATPGSPPPSTALQLERSRTKASK